MNHGRCGDGHHGLERILDPRRVLPSLLFGVVGVREIARVKGRRLDRLLGCNGWSNHLVVATDQERARGALRRAIGRRRPSIGEAPPAVIAKKCLIIFFNFNN